MDDADRATLKMRLAWYNSEDSKRRELLRVLHDDFGMSVKNIGILLGLTNGEVRYAYWKHITSVA